MISTDARDGIKDEIKGVLILLVLIGHAIYPYSGSNGWSENPVFLFIYSFHMPLFMYLSGYFSYSSVKKTFQKVLINKVRRVLVPYIVYTALVIIILTFEKTLVEYNWISIYWYLICLFILSIFFRSLWTCSKPIKVILFTIYILLIVFYNHIPKLILKDCQVLRLLPIFGIGLFYHAYEDTVLEFYKKHQKSILTMCIISVAMIRLFLGWNIGLYTIPIRIIDGILCSILAYIVLCAIFRIANSLKELKFLIWIGRNSLAIYCIHMVYRFIITPPYLSIEYSSINIIILSIIYLLCSIFSIIILSRIVPEKYLYIFGL